MKNTKDEDIGQIVAECNERAMGALEEIGKASSDGSLFGTYASAMAPSKAGPTDPDRRAIWTDCPHCARKHLLAAYAWLTQDTGTEISVTACGLLLARSEILLGEAIAGGYIGNAALAAGCLAAVEGVAHTNFGALTRHQLRQIRLDLDALNLTEALFGLGRLLPTDMSGRHVAAHLVEARRELPELGDMPGIGTFDGGYRHTNCSELRDWLVKTVRQLEETYELGAGSGDPIWQSGVPTFRKKEGKTNV